MAATIDDATTTTTAESSDDGVGEASSGDGAEPSTTTGDNLKECGNGVVEGDELCDDGNIANDDDCLSNCMTAFCGDGEKWGRQEECDDGNASATDACTPNCKAATCGDGQVWAGHEVCDDGFNDNEYNGCKPGCTATADEYCGDGEVHATYEHCDGPTGMANVGCDNCLFDFRQIPQMSCTGSCSYGPQQGCGKDDADVFCKLLTGNASATAISWDYAPPTDLGGFACSDSAAFIELNGSDPRKFLGPMLQYGVAKSVAWQATKIKSSHGNALVLQAADLECDG